MKMPSAIFNGARYFNFFAYINAYFIHVLKGCQNSGWFPITCFFGGFDQHTFDTKQKCPIR